MKEKTIFGVMTVLLLFLMTIGVASADTPSTRVVLAVGDVEQLTIDGSVGMTLDSVYYVPGAIDNGANIIFSVKNSVNDVVPVAKFMAQGTKLQFNGLTFYVERVGETSIILSYSTGDYSIAIPNPSVINLPRAISTQESGNSIDYSGEVVVKGCKFISATQEFLKVEGISYRLISSRDVTTTNFEDLFSDAQKDRSLTVSNCASIDEPLPQFNVAISETSSQNDVKLLTKYLVYLNNKYSQISSAESDYVVNIMPVGVAVLFNEFDFSKLDSQITVVMFNNKAVIVVGQHMLPTFVDFGKDVLINPSGLEGDYACAQGCKEVEDGCLCPKIRITKKSGQGFEIASSTSNSVVAKEIRIQPGADYIEAISADYSLPSVKIGNSDLAEGMAVDVVGYSNVFVSTNKNSLETYLKEGQISVKTRETLINDENGLSVETSSGNKELKVLPTVASEKAKEVLSDKYSELELKEVGNKIVYVSNDAKQYKIFGFIPASSQVTAQIDAETGETQVSNPWYAGISVETK